jgi:Na+/proline symporter
VVQRILSARDERHGLLATLWFTIAHYALRPWPWILVGFVGLIRYPGLANPEEGYVRVMVDVLPSPYKGLLLAAFAAAYMSTISTHLNWGASYLVNDVYLRFIRPNATPRAQVIASRLATTVLMVCSLIVMSFLSSVEQGWKILIGLGAGTGLVFILRWYWWRINAWSEISAMVASLITSIILARFGYTLDDLSKPTYAITMLITVGVTTVVWLAVTFATAPESPATLDAFYRRVRPGGRGWRPVSARLGFAGDTIPGGALSWVNWVAGLASVYCAVVSLGSLLTGSAFRGVLYGAGSIVAFALIQRNLRADAQLAASVDRSDGGHLGLGRSMT